MSRPPNARSAPPVPAAPAAPGAPGPDKAAAARTVPCPVCRQPARFAPDNPWRPFCGARCRGIDLGAWASEDYRVDAASPPDDDGQGSTGNP